MRLYSAQSSEFEKLAKDRQAVTRQGAHVYVTIPNDRPSPELYGVQRAIVLSSQAYNRSGSKSVHICPITPLSEPGEDGKSFALHTGYITSTSLEKLTPVREERSGAILPEEPFEFVQYVVDGYISTLSPTPSKMKEKADGWNLAYGQIGYFRSIPFVEDPNQETLNVPGLWLTPLEAFKQNGVGFVARSYTNITKYDPRKDVVEVVPRFKPERFCTSNIQALSPERIQRKGITPRTRIDEKAIRAIVSKLRAHFYTDDHARVSERYCAPIGELPVAVEVAMANYHRRRDHGAGLR